MLREFFEKKHYKFVKEAKSWQEAIRMSCEPLLLDNTITEKYVDCIIQNVEEYGPYIVIIPNVAMPHSQISAEGVNRTAVTFMKLDKAVSFDENDPEKDAKLFFTVASCNPDQHMDNIVNLSKIFENEELINELLEIETGEELLKLQEKYLD